MISIAAIKVLPVVLVELESYWFKIDYLMSLMNLRNFSVDLMLLKTES